MMIHQKIVLALSLWTSLVLVLVGGHNLELFGILLLIGILISRELTSTYTDLKTGDRMDTFIYIGIIFFVAVVSRRILDILEII
ncbi:MAG: hypothetical protein ACOCT7_00865 [Candidatus Saliniplasma sp.]